MKTKIEMVFLDSLGSKCNLQNSMWNKSKTTNVHKYYGLINVYMCYEIKKKIYILLNSTRYNSILWNGHTLNKRWTNNFYMCQRKNKQKK